MQNCKKTSKLVSESLDRNLSLRDNLKMWLHLIVCGYCLRFRSNAIAIQRRVNELEEGASTSEGIANDRLSDEAKAKIRVALERNK